MTCQLIGYAEVMSDKTRWLTEREQRAWKGLKFMHMRLDGELGRLLAQSSSLTLAEYAVLVALTEDNGGPCRVVELGQVLGWEKSRLSHQLTRMVKKGLVTRTTCEDDGRGAFIDITSGGRESLQAAAPGHVDAVRDLFLNHLTAEQVEALGDIADIVLAQLDKADT